MHTVRRFGLRIALFLALLSSVCAADFNGQWKAEFDTMIGVQKYVFDFKAEEGKLTGTATGEREGVKTEVPIIEGRVTDDHIAFVELLHYQGMDLRISYQGTLVGDEIKLTRRVGEFVTEPLVAKRAN